MKIFYRGGVRILLFLSVLLVLGSLNINAQTTYRAGFAKASIEPASFPFSLALAGYGAPREGRFSLEWIRKADVGAGQAFAAADGHLFSVKGADLMISKLEDKLSWKRIGSSLDIKLLAASEKKLYSVDASGNVRWAYYGRKLRWNNIGMFKNARSFAVSKQYIYAADENGSIFSSSLNDKISSWEKVAELRTLQSLAAYQGDLYALSSDNNLLKLNPDHKDKDWLRIARYNGISYDVDIKSLAIVNNVLYGLDAANILYAGQHQTRGDLSVTALAVTAGKQKVVLLGADLCGFNNDFTSSVKREIFRKHGIPAAAVLINASHTHFAPVSQHWDTWAEHNQQPDSNYLYAVVKPAILRSVEQAIKDLAVSELYFGRGKTAIGGNRALTQGIIPYDDDVDVISVVRKKDGKKTVMFLTGCHPVAKNEGAEGFTISANYPAVTRSALQKNSSVLNAMFIQGCGGDINPMAWDYVKTGEDLARDVTSVLNKPQKKLAGEISFFLDSIGFPVKRWSKEELSTFKAQNSSREGDVSAEKNVRWADLMLKKDKENKMPDTMPVYIQTINIGEWKLIGLSREAVTDYSIGIKKLWPEKLVSVAGYCNDVSSYLPTERHIQAKVYEGLDSFFWYAQPSVFPESVYQTILSHINKQKY